MYYGRIRLVGTYLDLVKRAIILAAAVVLAVVDSAADMLVCVFCSHFYIFLSFPRRPIKTAEFFGGGSFSFLSP